jgi:hypothetical protein
MLTSKEALTNVREALSIEGDRSVGDFIHAKRSQNLILLLACKIRCRMSLHSVLHIGDCSKTFMCIFARIPTRGIKPYNALQAKKKEFTQLALVHLLFLLALCIGALIQFSMPNA